MSSERACEMLHIALELDALDEGAANLLAARLDAGFIVTSVDRADQRLRSLTVSIATKVDVLETCGRPEIFSPRTIR